MKLYYSPGACSLAPHIALEESGQPFEVERVAIAEGRHLAPEYLAVNPGGRVPALAVDGAVITEVPAVLAFIADRAPAAGLLPLPPEDAIGRARCLEWLCWLSSNVHIAYAQIWRPQRFLDERADPGPLKDGGMRNVRAFYAAIESRLQGEWATGGRYSVVDPFLLVFYRWGERIGLSMASCPSWSRHAGCMIERPTVRRAMAREGIGLT